MIKSILSTITLTLLFSAQSQSSNEVNHNQSCELNYPAFEVEVPHFDLVKCPKEENVSASEGFCRLSVIGDKSYLYTFKLKNGAMCLADAKEVPLSDYLTK